MLLNKLCVARLTYISQGFGNTSPLELVLGDFPLRLQLEILTNNHQIESDLHSERLQSLLDVLPGKCNPISGVVVLSNENWSWLQPVQLIEMAFVRHIADKMIDILLFFLLLFIFFEDEWLRSTETVVQFPDWF